MIWGTTEETQKALVSFEKWYEEACNTPGFQDALDRLSLKEGWLACWTYRNETQEI